LTLWNKEMEIDPKARGGEKVFRFDPAINLVPKEKQLLKLDPWVYTVYLACDPHPKTPDAFLWLAAGKDGTLHVICSWWPGPLNEDKLPIKDCIRTVEGWNKVLGVKPRRKLMDPAGKEWNADEKRKINWFDAYQENGMTFLPAKKNFEYRGYAKINDYLVPEKAGESPRLLIWDGCGDNARLIERLTYLRWKEIKGAAALVKDAPEEPEDKEKHLPDCLSMIMLDEPHWIATRTRFTIARSCWT